MLKLIRGVNHAFLRDMRTTFRQTVLHEVILQYSIKNLSFVIRSILQQMLHYIITIFTAAELV